MRRGQAAASSAINHVCWQRRSERTAGCSVQQTSQQEAKKKKNLARRPHSKCALKLTDAAAAADNFS